MPRRLVDTYPHAVVDPDPVERRFVVMGDYLYYAGSDPAAGVELFRASVSNARVELVRDIASGESGSYPFGLVAVGKRLYFFAAGAASGFELWVSDGSAAGTSLVMDLYPGLASSTVPNERVPAPIGVYQGDLLFGAEDANGAYGLWRSDGTPAGTVRLRTLGRFDQRTPLLQFVNTGTFACFLLPDDTINGARVWRTDGTSLGTGPVLDLANTPDTFVRRCALNLVGSQVFVTAPGNLWRIDATAPDAHQLLKETGVLHAGLGCLADPGNPQRLVFYFSAGTQLWRSDGTVLGTQVFYPQRGVGVLNSYRQDVSIVNGRMYFLGFDLQHGEELWSSDGSVPGTSLVVDVRPGPIGSTGQRGFGRVRSVVSSGGLVYFAADDGQSGVELYVTDGTAAGTSLVSDINPGASGSNPRRILSLGGTRVAFLADDGGPGASGPGLYVSERGKVLRKVASNFVSRSVRTRESRVLGLRTHDDRVFFAADDGTAGSEPWCSDGTPAGTHRVFDLWSGPGSGLRHHDWANGPAYGVMQGVSLGKDLFFTAYRGDRDLALFKTDGSKSGTVRVQDLQMVNGVGWPLQGLGVGTTLFSHAVSKTQGEGLFSFGTGSSLTLLAKVLPGSYHRFGRRLIFTDGTPPTLRGVWITDGTVAGTLPLRTYSRMVFDPFCIVDFGGKVLFSTMNLGGELFETDGTPVGTRKLRGGVAIRAMAVAQGRLFILEEVGSTVHLTVGDGTPGGTVVLHNNLPASAQGLLVSGSRVFFHGFVGNNSELWVSDGSVTGTRMVHRFGVLSPALPRIEGMQAIGSRRVFFRVETTKGVGVELWQSDGTSQGTHLMADIQRGPGSGVDGQLAHARGKLFFRGDDGRSGSLDGDLWVADLGGLTYQVGDGCAATGFPPVLDGTDPVLGGTFDIEVEGSPQTSGVILVGLAYEPGMELGFGCRLFVDPGTGIPLHFQTSSMGRARFANNPVPNLPANLGLRLMVQVALGSTSKAPLMTDLSNGLVLILGY
ncbi:MAG: ELWxxDGT repeat protein [Planctomycetota bacterium]|nr:ELWxxDGT repeat protein [Planctomycetota bacterium]